MAAQLSSFEGTSAASPLSAGFFALIASRVGCRLGDPHAAMYSLGRGQFDGGPIVYNAITQGTVATDGVPGPTAGVGYNSASGWGSFDVAAMAAAWPPCPPLDAGYGFDGGIQAEASYSQCAFIACDAGTPCVTLPEGPASCEIPCSATQACGPDYLCTPGTIFADAGLCVLGCATDADCGPDGGVCNSCEETCVPPGAADAGVGIACASPLDCPTSGLCLTYDMSGNQWLDGYCTLICNTPGDTAVCSCPAGSVCDYAMGLCMQSCPTPGPSGCRSGYVCQPDGDGTSSCQVPCSLAGGIDSCSASETPDLSCDLNSGVCGGPVALPDGGSDAGAVADAGHAAPDAGPAVQDAGPAASDGGVDAGAPTPAADAGASADAGAAASKSSGCNCGAGAEAGDLPLLLGALFSLSRRRRKLTRG
jgi:MYXO-CTERM domain-containing protein